MALKLYGAPLSPYVRSVRIAFIEKGLDYEFVPMGLADLQEQEYEQLHPFRKVPALGINGQSLYETSAIMRYIDEAHANEVKLQPSDPLERSYCEQWLSVGNSYLYRTAFTGFFFQKVLAPKFGMPSDNALMLASAEKMRRYIKIIATALSKGELGKNPQPMLSDILVSAILAPLQTIEQGREILAMDTSVVNWINSLVKRRSFISTAK